VRPSVLAKRLASDRVEVRVSWNGATGVSSWRVRSGRGPHALATVATEPRTGFETAIAVRASAPYIAVQALDRSGEVIGSSALLRP
jgi:hypothetical protein